MGNRFLPSAIEHAPVSVAMSIMAAGLKCLRAYVIASATISLPSASVLMISMVFPESDVTTSPGRSARPPKIFGCGNNADNITLELQTAQRLHQSDTAAPPAIRITSHAFARLERNAAAVKGNRLPTTATGAPCRHRDIP